jgi:hypothetical protein
MKCTLACLFTLSVIAACRAQCSGSSALNSLSCGVNLTCSNASQACPVDGILSAQCNNTRTNMTCPLLYPTSVSVFNAYDGKVYTVGQSILVVALFRDGLCGLPQPNDIGPDCTPVMKLRLNTASGGKCFDVAAARSVYQAELEYDVSFLSDITLNTLSGPYNHWVFPFRVTSGMNTPKLEFLGLTIPPACNVTGKYNFGNWTRLDTKLPPPYRNTTVYIPPPPVVVEPVINCTRRPHCDGCCRNCMQPPPPPPPPPPQSTPPPPPATDCFTLAEVSGMWDAFSTTITATGVGFWQNNAPDFHVYATDSCNVFRTIFITDGTRTAVLSSNRATIYWFPPLTGGKTSWARSSAAAPLPVPIPVPTPPPPPPPPPPATFPPWCPKICLLYWTGNHSNVTFCPEEEDAYDYPKVIIYIYIYIY